jgi:CPA1 family monovalent cation:H+ antiporter
MDSLEQPAGELALAGVILALVVIAVRLVHHFTVLAVDERLGGREPIGRWERFIVGWAGMRGAISLAAALAIPLRTDAGRPFPERPLIVFLAFTVIFTTLVLQGLSLPLVIRALRLERDGDPEEEEALARVRAAEAALERLDELAQEGWVRDGTADRMRGTYTFRRRRFAERLDAEADGSLEERSLAYQRLRAELLAAERGALLEMRREGLIGDEVMQRIERDLDLEHSRLDAPVAER